MARRGGMTTRWGVVAVLGLVMAGLLAAEPAAAGTGQTKGLRPSGGYGVVQAPGYAPRGGGYGSVPAPGWTLERRWRDHDRDGDRDGWRDPRWGHGPSWHPGWHRPSHGGWWGPHPIYRPGQWIWNGWGWVWVPAY